MAANPGMKRALYLMDASTGAAHQLTDDATKSRSAPTSDGKVLAYQSDPDNWSKTAQVWVMDITGKNKRSRRPHRLHDGVVTRRNATAFESDTNDGADTQYDIWLVNADGSNLRNLTQGRSNRNYGPSWSPDGRQIAFAANQGRTGSQKQIHVVDVATGETKQLTTAGANQIP